MKLVSKQVGANLYEGPIYTTFPTLVGLAPQLQIVSTLMGVDKVDKKISHFFLKI